MSAVWNTVMGGVQSRFSGSHHSPTGDYEDQSSPVITGYQPKNVAEKRMTSAPPSISEELINAPALKVTLSGQAELGRRKRCASMHAEGRPPKLPPVNQSSVSPLTSDLAGTNVSYPSMTDTQSPPSGAQSGLEKPVFYDIHSPEKNPRERSPRGRDPRSRSVGLTTPRSNS